ncbi:MAG: DUF4432 domain-containing protein [Anaerolineaceae bacterium]|nr:DUF4432 domain-containing protein [Anaerolineaceae bacterium]
MARFHLAPAFFSEKEKIVVEHDSLTASAIRYDSGVCGLKLANDVGHIIVLPFQGQQIWTAEFYGRTLTMKSMFDEPRATRQYMENYGGFLLHCGAMAMGVPGANDTHPLHGELPHAPYQKAFIDAGEDERGPYLAIGGSYQHIVAFSANYLAEPTIKVYAGSGLLHVSMAITNLKKTDMELMYMAHVNFRPVDYGQLVYSAPATTDHVRTRPAGPHLVYKPDYAEFLEELGQHPERHHHLTPEAQFDPEVVFYIDYLADADGWAHSMQVHPDGSADYISHQPGQLDTGVRWISRTADQDALGIVLPATAGAEGYTVEKAKGKVRTLPAQERFFCEIIAGALDAAAAKRMEANIQDILA